MIYLELLVGFLKVGLFAFGGAYGAIPLIRDVVLSYGWINDEMPDECVMQPKSAEAAIAVLLRQK